MHDKFSLFSKVSPRNLGSSTAKTGDSGNGFGPPLHCPGTSAVGLPVYLARQMLPKAEILGLLGIKTHHCISRLNLRRGS